MHCCNVVKLEHHQSVFLSCHVNCIEMLNVVVSQSCVICAFSCCVIERGAVRKRAVAALGRPGRLCSGHEGHTHEHQLPVIQQLHAAHWYVVIIYLIVRVQCPACENQNFGGLKAT